MNIPLAHADPATLDPCEAAVVAGLLYVSDEEPGIRRRRAGRGFFYTGPKGEKITDAETLKRIRALVIPPAWTDVWISPLPDGHLQATGRDGKGRKQYKYHTRFRDIRDATKFERLASFANTLPTIRKTVAEHMSQRGLSREKILATVVHLLETTLIRVGNIDYAKQNESYGLTTLQTEHVEVVGTELRFGFKGKSGKHWNLRIRDRRIARVIRACQDLPGQSLFQYKDDDGSLQSVTSADVNAYLREITGADITAKDFRTWAGTVGAAVELAQEEPATSETQLKKQARKAIERVAAKLGNTVTVCKTCYIHPVILDAHKSGELANLGVTAPPDEKITDDLRADERAVLALLDQKTRLNKAS